ncbi:MAG: hypothetical protein DRP11_02355 [Candidatus Aenigmatarchaeota archaeon]|nr:MAG: hypothetical protein DRP11_02355 [Candidatus Aenigmarchaeota archaeon]
MKRLDTGTIIMALIISTLIFLSGVFFGWSINKEKISYMKGQIDDLNNDLEAFQLEFLFLNFIGENATCPLLQNRIIQINQQSYELGNRIQNYENDEEFKDMKSLDELKRDYYRLLIRYWLLSKKMDSACKSQGSVSVLYFFSRNCSMCDEESFLLTYFKKKLNEKLLVFALDSDFDDPFIKVLKDYYGISEYPSVVIEDNLYEGFKNRDELKDLICKESPDLEICTSEGP